jgi:hypothetical protein
MGDHRLYFNNLGDNLGNAPSCSACSQGLHREHGYKGSKLEL